MSITKENGVLHVAIFMLLLLLLAGCGKSSDKNSDKNYIGRYKEYHTGGLKRYLEINEDSTASIYDSYDTYTGEWKETENKKTIELKLSEFGTEMFYAEFAEDDNIDVLKVSGGYYGDDMAYYIREDSETHNMLANYDVQQVLDALSEGVSINEINTYISNTAIAESNQSITQTVIDQNVSNSETIENTIINTTININNYKEPETKINGENFEGLLKEAQKQSEDVMTAYVAKSYSDGEKFKKMDYLGYYVLSPKGESSENPFQLYLVYKVYVNTEREGDISYYWYCKFDNAEALGENEYSIDLSDYRTPSSNYYSPTGYSYDGCDSLDSLFYNVVAKNLDKYNYDSDIHDIENEETVIFNNGESFEELLEKAQKHGENENAAYVAKSYSPGEQFEKMDYLGYYFLTAKNEDKSNPFKLYLVYKIYVNTERDGDLSYYWYCRFDNIISLGENKYSIDLSACSTPDDRYTSPTGYSYKGYETLDEVFDNAVAEYIADYKYYSEINDAENENKADDTSEGN